MFMGRPKVNIPASRSHGLGVTSRSKPNRISFTLRLISCSRGDTVSQSFDPTVIVTTPSSLHTQYSTDGFSRQSISQHCASPALAGRLERQATVANSDFNAASRARAGLGTGRPILRAPSIHSRIAVCAACTASSGVSPSAMHPGSSGTCTR